MNIETVINLYNLLKEANITVWLDGGWGVDALMAFQTRYHDDLDLVIEERNLEKLVRLLRELGYDHVPRDDTRAWNFVLGDKGGNLVDTHVININKNGDGIYGPLENGELYPAQALSGVGLIDGNEVKCLSSEYQLISHTGYELKKKDRDDVMNLCKKFKFKPPDIYQNRGIIDNSQ